MSLYLTLDTNSVNAALFLLLPQPGVQQSLHNLTLAALLHHGVQCQIGLLMYEGVFCFSQFQQENAACSLSLWVHGPLEVRIQISYGVHSCTGHSGAQVFHLNITNKHHQSRLLHSHSSMQFSK